DNGIPVCFDCHAEIESKSNMGRGFSRAELRLHRDRWFEIVKKRPEALIEARANSESAGPLEAMLAELQFAISVINQAYPAEAPDEQFQRAMATNSLSALPPEIIDQLHGVYASLRSHNLAISSVAFRDRIIAGGSVFQTPNRNNLLKMIPAAIEALRGVLDV